MRILFTGGGTGGHLFPIIAVARAIKNIAEKERILDARFFYVGPETEGETMLAREEFIITHIAAGKIRRYPSWKNYFDPFNTCIGVIQALWNIFFIMPDVVFSKGGYGSFPALIASRIYRLPVIIHESDAVPGKVNRWAAKFAKRIAVSFEKTAGYFPKEKTAVTGNPIRARVFGGSVEEAQETFKVFSGKQVILVLGGSQGSQTLNQTVIGVIKELTRKYEVIHQTGRKNFNDVASEAKVILEKQDEDYHPLPFLNEGELRNAYRLADIIVSRAGASAIFEIAAWGKPAILVPLKDAAQDHQRENAYEYARSGAAVVIEEANLTPWILLHEIEIALSDKDRMKRMGESAQRFSRIDGAEIIAKEILKLGLH